MATKIFTNISLIVNTRVESVLLRGKELAHLPVIRDGYIVVEDDIIAEIGKMEDFKHASSQSNNLDAGTILLPCWCDSHSHLVFSGSRENEFVDKLKGLSYAGIAAKGGGILNSARQM